MTLFKKEIIQEGRLVTVKRKYTENHPEKYVQLITPVRNSVLNYVAENDKVTKQELKEFFKQFNEETGRNSSIRWFTKNINLFKESKINGQTYISLSELGRRVIEKTKLNESAYINDVLNEDYGTALVKTIAKRLELDLGNYDLEQIRIGMIVELEHGLKFGDFTDITGDDPVMTLKIVIAHLMEDPKYYTNPKAEGWGIKEAGLDKEKNTQQFYEYLMPSTPLASTSNTLGMGNVVTPSVGTTGSGDRFDNGKAKKKEEDDELDVDLNI